MERTGSGKFVVIAVVCFVAAFLAPILVFGAWKSGLGVGLTSLFMGVGLWCVRFAKQARLRGAEAILAQDPRPPILYLRAFRTDSSRSRLEDWRHAFVPWQEGYFEQFGGGLPFDVMLQPTVESILGPFIALGKPDDRLPPFGGARLYRDEEGWQESVHRLVKRAAAILMLGVESKGVLWELKVIRGESDPAKLFVLTPPGRHAGRAADWRAFLDATREIGYVLPADDPGPGAVLSFNQDWTATPILTDATMAAAYVDAVAAKVGSMP